MSFLFRPFWNLPDFSGIFLICPGIVQGFSRFVLFLFLGLLPAARRSSPERVPDTIRTFCEKSGNPPAWKPASNVGDRDRGGQNVPNARGGGTRPESCPWKAWTFDPQIEDFLKNLCRKGVKFRDPRKLKIFTPPLVFGDLIPPIPVSNNEFLVLLKRLIFVF